MTDALEKILRYFTSLFVFLSYSLSAPMVVGASYDCSLASSNTELVICEDFNLSVDDRVLSFLYGQRLRFPDSSRHTSNLYWFNDTNLTDLSHNQVVAAQVEWLEQERNPCGADIECLRFTYNSRINELLENVRLEPADSHAGNRTNFSSQDVEKEALRFVAAIFENIEKNDIFPSFRNGEAFFSTYGPNHFAHVETPIFYENTNSFLQGPLDWSVEVDYSSLTQCLRTITLDDVEWRGLPTTLSTTAVLSDCLELRWFDGPETLSGTLLFPHFGSQYISEVRHSLQTAYASLCEGYRETEPSCSEPSRRPLIEAVENMANWAISQGYANEHTISLILESWKMDYLIGPISDPHVSHIQFEDRSMGVINTIAHMRRFPNDLDFQRCRFDEVGELICPTLELSEQDGLTISGATSTCQIGEVRYRVSRQANEYQLHIDSESLFAPLTVPMRRTATGTGVCTYQYLETIPIGQISIDFGSRCTPDDYQPPATFGVYVHDYHSTGPIAQSVLAALPSGECQLEVFGQFEGHFD